MVPTPHNRKLEAEHQPAAIRRRLAAGQQPSYLAAAVVAGAVGGGFTPIVVIVLGFANLLADGFSMAASNYLSLKSQCEQVEAAR